MGGCHDLIDPFKIPPAQCCGGIPAPVPSAASEATAGIHAQVCGAERWWWLRRRKDLDKAVTV